MGDEAEETAMSSPKSGPTVLVTGANSAIGSASVDALLDRGAVVVATVRGDDAAAVVAAERESAVAAGRLTIERLEVTDADDCERVMARCRPTVVVNNAGAALLGAVCDVDDDAARAQLEVMVLGPVRLARSLIDVARHERSDGTELADRRVVNISSSLASTPMPFTGWYAASKSALDTVSERLRVEAAPLGVAVVTVECGAVSTEAWDDAADIVRRPSVDDGTEAGRRQWGRITSWLEPRFADPEEVGRRVASVALDPSPPPVTRVGFGSRLGLASRLVPAPVRDLLGRTVFRLGRAR